MRLLELFSGTGSVGNVASAMGIYVISVDRDTPATHNCDMEWDYKRYPLNMLIYHGRRPLVLNIAGHIRIL